LVENHEHHQSIYQLDLAKNQLLHLNIKKDIYIIIDVSVHIPIKVIATIDPVPNICAKGI
jgi:hypothetical protein